MIDARSVIKKPLVTEKSTEIMEKGWYVFSVDKKANKKQIQDSVEKVFDVKVDKVRTLKTYGKFVKRMGRVSGRRTSIKKAYVKLKEGSIDLFEGV